jgi:hypothetical protein
MLAREAWRPAHDQGCGALAIQTCDCGAPPSRSVFLAVLGRFEGYFPGYSDWFAKSLNYLTWAVLEAHTNNRAGEVTPRSADPGTRHNINFRCFQEGTQMAMKILIRPCTAFGLCAE